MPVAGNQSTPRVGVTTIDSLLQEPDVIRCAYSCELLRGLRQCGIVSSGGENSRGSLETPIAPGVNASMSPSESRYFLDLGDSPRLDHHTHVRFDCMVQQARHLLRLGNR